MSVQKELLIKGNIMTVLNTLGPHYNNPECINNIEEKKDVQKI